MSNAVIHKRSEFNEGYLSALEDVRRIMFKDMGGRTESWEAVERFVASAIDATNRSSY